jgi:hypothetical protein
VTHRQPNDDWAIERIRGLAELRATQAETTAAERREDARALRDRHRVQRIVGGIIPLGEGDDWLHRHASGSTPAGSPNGESPQPPPPARAPQGARDGPTPTPSPDLWLRGAIDAARFGGSTWSTSHAEPGTWSQA